MLFNSLIFLLFGSTFFLFWPFLRHKQQTRWLFLISASFFFYGWWDWRFLFLIVFSGLVDFLAALAIEQYPRHRKQFLILSLLGNLGCLGIFKYSRFFAESLDRLLAMLDLPFRLAPAIPPFLAMVPVGISFYTFQSMSYTIDVYRGNFRPTRNIFHFFAYLSMFPQLVAGPIVRAADLLPQLIELPDTTKEDRWEGLRLIVHGYFKKMVIADNMAPVVNAAFGSSALETSSIYWWLIMTMFALQIYCDFSGYSDIARGLARWMGLNFPLNFNHPYAAGSLREFWQRWHISLSSWFKDYVYLPLGGSRVRPWKTYRNIWITMLLSGLWHGAAWTFLAWSAVHALFLSIERLSGWTRRMAGIRGAAIVTTIVILIQVWIGWVFFRAQSIGQALEIVRCMFSFRLTSFYPVDSVLFLKASLLAGFWLAVEIGAGYRLLESAKITALYRNWAAEIRLALMMTACIYLRGPGSAFIYFQF
ncbi:MAG: MBOAT family protein [Desulfobacteraceae bacterium]|nr:MAG: MBOAT family protein [Desulfobacteraceae bacterium]